MTVTAETRGRVLRVCLAGELDHHAALAAMTAVEAQLDRQLPRRCILDFGGVSFMDSSGIAVLLKTRRRMEELCGQVEAENVPPQAMRVLTAAGVGRLVALRPARLPEREEART